MIVVGIKYFYQVSRQIFLLYGLSVISLVKGIQLKAFDRFRIPDHQRIYHIVVVSDDRHIIGHRADGLVTFVDKFRMSVSICLSPYIASEFYFKGMLRTSQLKRISVF